jgi:Fe-S cluster assembly iron-binding protein IscA
VVVPTQGENVLQITHAAAELLEEVRREQDVPEDHGLRVFAETANPEEVTIGLGFTETPADGDLVSEQEGLKVFVAPEVAAPLSDSAIDVTPGNNGATRLVFRPQSEAASPPA